MFKYSEIVYSAPGRRTLQCGSETKHVKIETANFPDGELKVRVPGLHQVCGKKVCYVADWSPNSRMMDLSCLMAIAENSPAFLDILIPFSGAATMERETVEGEIAMANVEAKLLSCLPGPKRIVVPDLHTLQNKFYFHNASVRLPSLVPYLLDKARSQLRSGKSCLVVFPDEGAKKRYCPVLNLAEDEALFCTKVRSGDKRVVFVDEPRRAHGREIVIIDDLARTGATLVQCATTLVTAGATKVIVVVPHAVLPGNAAELIENCEAIDAFLTTDSVMGADVKLAQYPKFHCWPISFILA